MKRPCLTYLFLSVLLPLLLVSCRKDPLPVSSEEAEQGSGVYVSIVVNTESTKSSRADGATDEYDPTGGEEGDGKWPGQNTDNYKENVVHDLNVFFFEGDDGINSSSGTLITHCLYFSQEENNLFSQVGQNGYDATYYSATVEVSDELQIGKTYHVLVIANYGSSLVDKFSTLDDLRDFQVSQTITASGYFLMSSETDASITVKANHENNPESVFVNIERLTARVDCRVQKEYSIEGSNDKVEITHATLVNKNVSNSYAFKRVTKGITGSDLSTISYLGTETVDQEGKVTNYVIDPYTLSNNSKQYDIPYFELDGILNTDSWTGWKSLVGVDAFLTDENDYTKVDYVNENVILSDLLSMSNTTGIVFKAKYTPADKNSSSSDGTFYKYQNEFYPSLETIREKFDLKELTSDNYGDYGIECYEKGICYYTYWIRHADDKDGTKFSPMEYAIVRNNIYQLTVKSVSRLGSDTPDDSEIDLPLEVVVIRAEVVENEVVFN